MQACNYVSNWIFDHNFVLGQAQINKALYYVIRDKFNLKAQLTQSVIRAVVARYRTVKTQLAKKPYHYYDQANNKNYYIKRDLTWLQKPIKFNKPQADLQRDRDWSLANNQLSLNTLGGRIKTTYICKGFDQYLNNDWKLGLGKLIKQRNHWYFYVSATRTLPDYNLNQTQHVVGIDRGLRFLATCYDEQGRTKFFSGKSIIRKRNKYKRLRQELQKRNTKSAKRRLKKIGQRENRWMSDVNHCLSKTLVNFYGKNTLFVLEDLTYKANLNQSHVCEILPEYTSQRCPKCGRINKANRNHDLHLYQCDRCGYTSNDDRFAGMNIQFLRTEIVSGITNPKFKNNN